MQRKFFLLAICILSVFSTNSQDYFAGICIDPILLQQANQALLDLKSALHSNLTVVFLFLVLHKMWAIITIAIYRFRKQRIRAHL